VVEGMSEVHLQEVVEMVVTESLGVTNLCMSVLVR
jgi:hypothetical protein